MLARSYPKLPLTGLLSGPITAKGTIADLAVTTNLQGPAGALSFAIRSGETPDFSSLAFKASAFFRLPMNAT